MDRIDIKNLHSRDLKRIKKIIEEELDFRDECGEDIKTKNEYINSR